MDVQKQDRELGYKQTADKIRQILSKVRETPRHSYKRWVWELMQNAKDVKDPAYGSVSVKIVLDQSELTFSHNGLPFLVKHLLGIVKQVSTKSSTGEDEEVTGKFGTGFIVTHLLSDTIDIQGYIDNEDGSYFKLETLHLDREGHTSEELIPKIEKANEYILKVEHDRVLFPLVPDYNQNRKRENFDTVFKYSLSSDPKKEAATEGIYDLTNTLPVTLVSVEEISEVTIEDNIKAKTYHYQMTPVENGGLVKKISVAMDNDQPRNFVKYIQDDFCLIAEVTDFDSCSLVPKADDQPVLYRNFPLIGSEIFYFPFIVNGFKFNPNDNRDNIVLVNEESKEVQSNRAILKSVIEGVIAFTEYLINTNAKNRHLCALSRIPKLSVPIEDEIKEWLDQLQLDWRKKLIELDLIETEDGSFTSLSKGLIPNHGSTNEQKNQFHSLASAFLGKDIVPKSDQNLDWIAMTGPKTELESWEIDVWYDLENMLSDLQEIGNLELLKKNVENPIEWLNKLYSYIEEVKETESLNEFSIIPNHQAVFKKLEDLYLEDQDSEISDSFLDILESLDENWREELIHREVLLLKVSVETKGLSDVSKTINDILNEKKINSVGVDEYQFKLREDALSILKDIVRTVDSDQTNDFKNKIYTTAKSIFGFTEDLSTISNVKDFQFRIALKLLIMSIHEDIQNCITVEKLAQNLGLDEDSATIWLNEYFNLIQNKEDFKSLIDYGNIIPNRDGEFCAYEDVYAFGTEETPLDDELIEILYELDENQNWRRKLIYEGISIKQEPRKFEELGTAVDNTLKELEKEETLNPGSLNSYKQTIYKLLDWCKNHEKLTDNYLTHTGARANDLWVKFSMTPEIMSILRDEGSIELLKEIAKADLSEEDKRKVIDIAKKFGTLSEKGKRKLVEQAEEILEDERDFEFKRQVGAKVEDALKVLFEVEFPIYQIKYVGKGAYDFLITNPENHKKYSIELKSIKHNNYDSIKMAISQARYASKYPDHYALLVIRRPEDKTQLTDRFLLDNLICVYQIGNNVKVSVDNSFKVESIINSHESIKLSIEDPTMKVYIRQEYIDKLGKSFDSLKLKVHEAIK